MEAKKTVKADLDNKKVFLFSLSLAITMSLVVVGFEWKYTSQKEIDLVTSGDNVFENSIEVPVTEIPPPPPPKVLESPQIIEVPNDEEIKEEISIKFDVEMNEATKVSEIKIFDAPVEVEKEENEEEIFLVVEQPAVPKGGLTAFYQDISERIQYPASARRMNIEGKVFVEFVVNRDGSITDVVAIKGIGAGCDEEAVRVVKTSAAWNPAKQRGKAVKQRLVLPITFKLRGNI